MRSRTFEEALGNYLIADGCWVYQGYIDAGGYSHYKKYGVLHSVHRVSYEVFKGKIPEGLQIDHLCRNRACINPDHLEAVTPRENILRSTAITANHARKTHCSRGHEFTPENTYRWPRQPNSRMCRACIAHYDKLRKRKAVLRVKQALDIESES